MNKKILIVEDDISIAELQRDYLEVNGFSVHVEQSGESGLAQALEGDYDLIILDVMLPHVDGFELCKQIRARKNIPILMVTAKKEEIDTIRGFGLGADDYVIKPFSPRGLLHRVNTLLARRDR